MSLFPKHEEMQKLLTKLRKLRLESLEESLSRLVDEEAEALLGISQVQRRTQSAEAEAQRQAEEYYADEITGFMARPDYTLTPDDVLSYRRKAGAWAVAQKILAEEKLRLKLAWSHAMDRGNFCYAYEFQGDVADAIEQERHLPETEDFDPSHAEAIEKGFTVGYLSSLERHEMCSDDEEYLDDALAFAARHGLETMRDDEEEEEEEEEGE